MPIVNIAYKPHYGENEDASNSYLMSLVAVLAGMPLPIVNLLASFFFWFSHRKSTLYVRWHCMQNLVAQVPLFFANAGAFWWTIALFFNDAVTISDHYIAYIILVALLNVIEFVIMIITASKVRNGRHVHWWLFGDITQLIYQL